MASTGQGKSGDGSEPIRVLQLEDNPVDAELVVPPARRRRPRRVVSRVVADELGFRHAIGDFAPQIILSDFSLPRFRRPRRRSDRASDVAPRYSVHLRVGHDRRGARDRGAETRRHRLRAQGQSAPPRAGDQERAAPSARSTQAKELAEDMLRRSESRLQDIINTSRDWIWECDREGRFTFSSPSVQDVLGYSRSRDPRPSRVGLHRSGRRAAAAGDVRRAPCRQTTCRSPVTLRWRHKDGKTRWLERTMVALRDANGALARRARHRPRRDAAHGAGGAHSPPEPRAAVLERRELSRDAHSRPRPADQGSVPPRGQRRRLRARRRSICCRTTARVRSRLVCSYGDARRRRARSGRSRVALPEGVTPVTQALATAEPIVLNDLADASDIGSG